MNEEELIKEIQNIIDAPKAFFEVGDWYQSENKSEFKLEGSLQYKNSPESIARMRFGIKYSEKYGKQYGSFRLDFIPETEDKHYCTCRIDFNDGHTNKKPFKRETFTTTHIHPFLKNVEEYGLISALEDNLPYAEKITDGYHLWADMIEIASKQFNIDDIRGLPKPPFQEELQLC